jgi:type III secretion system HrpE/YscL family protein
MESAKIIKATAEAEPAGDALKLVKKDAFAAMLDAVTILDTAREQARAIQRDAEDRAAKSIEEARSKGRQEGLERYLKAIVEAQQALDAFYDTAEPELVRLAGGIARKIVGEELQTSPETIVKIVREALATGRHARQIAIRVYPTDVAEIRAHVAQLGLAASCDVQVIPSDAVGNGGCTIESEFGIIDARLDTQLRVIEGSLLRSGMAQ